MTAASITQVRLRCTNCGFETAYKTIEQVPRLCPQCKRDSKLPFAWMRTKIPFLPALVASAVLFTLGPYDFFVARAKESPWLPYDVFALVFFGLPWMLVTLLLDWPKLPKGPHTMSQIKWARQDADPREIVGFTVVVRLNEHPMKRDFQSSIGGSRPLLMDLPEEEDMREEEGRKNDRVYILTPGKNPLGVDRILFHPEWVRFKRGAMKQLRKQCKGDFSYTASMEELLLNSEGPIKEVYGRIYETKNLDTLTKSEIPYSLLTTAAYGRVRRS